MVARGARRPRRERGRRDPRASCRRMSAGRASCRSRAHRLDRDLDLGAAAEARLARPARWAARARPRDERRHGRRLEARRRGAAARRARAGARGARGRRCRAGPARRRLRRRPDIRPVGVGDADADPVAGGGRPSRSCRARSSSSRAPPAGAAPARVSESRRVTFSMPFATRCDVPSGRDVDRLTQKPITRAVDVTCSTARGRPSDVHVLLERRRGVHERERLVGPLVAGQAELDAARPEPAGDARPSGRRRARRRRRRRLRRRDAPSSRQVEHALAPRRAPASAVSARHAPADSRRSTTGGSPCCMKTTTGGSSMTPFGLPAAPVVEPAHDLVQVVDARAGDRRRRAGVVPRPDQHLLRHLQRVVQPQRRVRVAVAPAADQEHGAARSGRRSSPDGAVAPVRAVGLVPEPLEQVGLVAVEVLLPDLRPVVRPLRVRAAARCRRS